MTWVKVCGLTRPQDVETAVGAGADAIGFVMVHTSPRAVSARQVHRLARDVPIDTIVLVADMDPAIALRVIEETGVTGIQPYGNSATELAEMAAASGRLALLPTPVRGPIARLETPDRVIPLLDTATPQRGGSGVSFDWSHVDQLETRFVLAGGLGPDNVQAAIRQTHAWGVDASSRLEKAPGIKDPVKVTAFIEEAKSP